MFLSYPKLMINSFFPPILSLLFCPFIRDAYLSEKKSYYFLVHFKIIIDDVMFHIYQIGS